MNNFAKLIELQNNIKKEGGFESRNKEAYKKAVIKTFPKLNEKSRR